MNLGQSCELNRVHGVPNGKPPKRSSPIDTKAGSKASKKQPTPITAPVSLSDEEGPSAPSTQKKGRNSLVSSPFIAGSSLNTGRKAAKGQQEQMKRPGPKKSPHWGESSFSETSKQGRFLDLAPRRTPITEQPQNRNASGSRHQHRAAGDKPGGDRAANAIEVKDDDDEADPASSPTTGRGPQATFQDLHKRPSPEHPHKRKEEAKPATRPRTDRPFQISEPGHAASDSDAGEGWRVAQSAAASSRASKAVNGGHLVGDASRDELDCLSDTEEASESATVSLRRRDALPKGKARSEERNHSSFDSDPIEAIFASKAKGSPTNLTSAQNRTKKMQGRGGQPSTSAATSSNRHGKPAAPTSSVKASSKVSGGGAREDFRTGVTSSLSKNTPADLPLRRLVLGGVEVDTKARQAFLVVHPGRRLRLSLHNDMGQPVTIMPPTSLKLTLGSADTPFLKFEPEEGSPVRDEMRAAVAQVLGPNAYRSGSDNDAVYCFGQETGAAEAAWERAWSLLTSVKSPPRSFITSANLPPMQELANNAAKFADRFPRQGRSSPADGRRSLEAKSPAVDQSPSIARPRPKATAAMKAQDGRHHHDPQPAEAPRKMQTRTSSHVPADAMYAKLPPATSKGEDGKALAPGSTSGPLRQYGAASKSPAAPEPDVQRFRYPVDGPGGVMVYQSDIDKLAESEFLNDTIIEWGLKVILDGIRQRDPELADSIYLFSSFFYKRFTQTRDRNAGFELVRKWTSKVDLFKKRFIIVPINENLHWFLAVVVNPSYAFDATSLADANDRAVARSLPQRGSARKSKTVVPCSEDEAVEQVGGRRPDESDAMDTTADSVQRMGEGGEEVRQRLEDLSVGEGQNGHERDDEAMDEAKDGFEAHEAAGPASAAAQAEGSDSEASVSRQDMLRDVSAFFHRTDPSNLDHKDMATNTQTPLSSPRREPPPPSSSTLSSVEPAPDPPSAAGTKRAAPSTPSQEAPPNKRRPPGSSPATPSRRRIPVRDARSPAEDGHSSEVVYTRTVMAPAQDGIDNSGQGKLTGGGPPDGAASSQTSATNGKRKSPVAITLSAMNSDDEDRPAASQAPASSQRRYQETSPAPLFSSRPQSEHGEGATTDTEQREPHEAEPEQGYVSLPAHNAKPIDATILDNVSNHTAVLIFDSLQQSHKGVTTALREYLAREWRARRAPDFDLGANFEALKDLVRHVDVKAPQQPNFCDCGVYLLHYVERFFADPDTFLTNVIPSKDRKHPAWSDQDVAAKRADWREKASALTRDWEERQRQLKEQKQKAKLDKLKEKQEAAEAPKEEPGGAHEERQRAEQGGPSEQASAAGQAQQRAGGDAQEDAAPTSVDSAASSDHRSPSEDRAPKGRGGSGDTSGTGNEEESDLEQH